MKVQSKGPWHHLDVETVLEIHAEAISQFGGSAGIRDLALLESAVAAPRASFGGESVYADLFFICRNHPFIDGNKRTALASCIVFLRLNSVEPSSDGPAWEDLTLAVAASELDRDQTSGRLRSLLNP